MRRADVVKSRIYKSLAAVFKLDNVCVRERVYMISDSSAVDFEIPCERVFIRSYSPVFVGKGKKG